MGHSASMGRMKQSTPDLVPRNSILAVGLGPSKGGGQHADGSGMCDLSMMLFIG